MAERIWLLDTTLRDGTLMSGVQFSVAEKVAWAQQLAQAGVDIIEVGYPAQVATDVDAIRAVAAALEQATLCVLASSQPAEIDQAAATLEAARLPRLHTYASVRIPATDAARDRLYTTIAASVSRAKQYCDDVEWSAFDATRSDLDVLCGAIAIALEQGATVINLPDSLGVATPTVFADWLRQIWARVPALAQVTVSVHCHDDLGHAIANSLVALDVGVRQLELSLQGIGARRGNAALEAIAAQLQTDTRYTVAADAAPLQAMAATLRSRLPRLAALKT